MRYNLQIVLFLLLSIGYAQPKFNIQVGSGFYSPNLIGMDSDSNSTIPKSNFLSNNLLLNWGIRYQIYPNIRAGYTQSHSIHLGKVGSSTYFRNIAYRSFSFETFYYAKERIEVNFTLAPMLNKGSISLTSKSEVQDLNTLLTSYKDGSTIKLKSGGTMTKTWIGFASHIGVRYYISNLTSIEAKAGYYLSSYKETNWKLEGQKVTGPKMKIGKLPVLQLNAVFGL